MVEKAFIKAILAEPDNPIHRMAYHDWLLENGLEQKEVKV